jgi:hypothetical protein
MKLTKILTVLATSTILVASASAVTISGSVTTSGVTRSGTADFSISGSTLTVALRNSSGEPAGTNIDLLTAVFFTLPQGVTLTPQTSGVVASSGLWVGTPSSSTADVIGNNWQYRGGQSLTGGTNAGISTAGFGVFSQGNFGSSGVNVQGGDYGLVATGTTSPTSPSFQPVYTGTFTFTLGFTGNLTTSAFTSNNVNFQFGTALNEPNTNPPTDTPPVADTGITVALLGGALLGLAALRRFLR